MLGCADQGLWLISAMALTAAISGSILAEPEANDIASGFIPGVGPSRAPLFGQPCTLIVSATHLGR